MSFKAAETKELPTLYCVGKVSDIGPLKETKVNQDDISYAYITFTLEGMYAAPRERKLTWMFRPEWLVPGFDPAVLRDMQGGQRLYDNYRRMINAEGGTSILAGLCGSAENFDKLATLIHALEVEEVEGVQMVNAEEVYQVIVEFFSQIKDETLVGYVLRQAVQRSEETDENGKNKWTKTNNYNVDSMFWPTDEELTKKRDYAIRRARSNNKLKKPIDQKITWDESLDLSMV